MKNKYILSLFTFIIGFLLIYSCKKMDDTYKDFIVPGGITYIGKADSVHSFAGRNRVKITWLRGTDSKAVAAVIYWNNKQDSVEVPITVTDPMDTVVALLDNLPEKTYNFTIYTKDADGHYSIGVDLLGETYDTEYESTLLTRGIQSITPLEDGSSINWYPSDTSSFVTEVNYVDEKNQQHQVFVPKDSSTVFLPGYIGGSQIYYTSFYKPTADCLDTFFTKTDSIMLNPNLLKANNWTVLRIANNDNVKFEQTQPGVWLASGGDGGHQGIYQEVEVEPGVIYKLDLHVKGSGAKDTWFEVYASAQAPAQGSDYTSGGVKLGLNTWTGCGKTAFDDQLSVISCSAHDNLLSFPDGGKVYIVIKTGGTSLGDTGITMSNIDLRKVN